MKTTANKAFVNIPSGLGRFQRPTILALCVNEHGLESNRIIQRY